MCQKLSMILCAGIILSGCGDPRINAATDDSMKESIEKVRQSLPQPRREQFDESIKILVFSQIDMKQLMADGASGTNTAKDKMKDTINGKTADEVISQAERIRAERKEKEQAQAIQEIQELENKQQMAERAKVDLASFQIIRSRFSKVEEKYGSSHPVIELTVKNGTSSPVSRAYFKGILTSPNRSVPWVYESFNYQIPGGLEPGEQAEWSLAPNMFGEWGKVDAPADAILTVEVVQLDGVDGKTLFSSRGVSESEKKRLEELKRRYSESSPES